MFYILPTQSISVFCVGLKNSHYFPVNIDLFLIEK
jgi:hypothetical protein